MKLEHESITYKLVNVIDKLPRHSNYPWNWRKSSRYYDIPGREINACYIHQKGGGYIKGFGGVLRTGRFLVLNPKYDNNGNWVGNGRGWPGYSYNIDIPHSPEIEDGKFIIYYCQNWSTVSWHTKGDNTNTIAVALQGYFKSKHGGRFVPYKGTNGKPSSEQMEALEDLVENFIKPKFNLDDERILGHFESPKPKLTCPGDFLTDWLMRRRQQVFRTSIPVGQDPFLDYKLDTWERRQAALVAIGYDIGEYGEKKNGVDGMPGERTRIALEAVERRCGLSVNGIWDHELYCSMAELLCIKGITQEEIDLLT